MDPADEDPSTAFALSRLSAQYLSTTVDRLVTAALETIHDPEIGRPITELGMVREVAIDGGAITVTVLLTVSGCSVNE